MSELLINSLLAAVWAGVATLLASGGELTKAALVAAGTAALRAGVVYLAGRLNHPIKVDS